MLQVTDKRYHTMFYRVYLVLTGFEFTISVVMETDCIDCHTSNYHSIMSTTALKCMPARYVYFSKGNNSMLCMSNNFKMIQQETKVRSRRVRNLKTRCSALTFHSALRKLNTEPSIGVCHHISAHLGKAVSENTIFRNRPI